MNIVPSQSVRSLTPEEIQNLCNQAEQVAVIYEDANVSLEVLDSTMYRIEKAGEKYNELTSSVGKKIAACCSKGVLGKVMNNE